MASRKHTLRYLFLAALLLGVVWLLASAEQEGSTGGHLNSDPTWAS